MTGNDLMFKIAERAKELANMDMPALRRAAQFPGLDLGDGTRGAIMEAILCEEFENDSWSLEEDC